MFDGELIRFSHTRPLANASSNHNGMGLINSWGISSNINMTNDPNKMEVDFQHHRHETFRHATITCANGALRVAVSLATAMICCLAVPDGPLPLIADGFSGHGRTAFDKSVKILNKSSEKIAINNITHFITRVMLSFLKDQI